MAEASRQSVRLPSNLTNMQAMLRRALASGTVPTEEEIALRTALADMLVREYEKSQRPQDLYDAINHIETILRRLPPHSPERLQHLDSLSYARMSEYGIENSKQALDEAVRYGKQARQEAVATGLMEKDPALYFKILNNAGYALSHRNAAVESVADLDEAIDCATEIKTLAPRESPEYLMTITNLLSRLLIRFSMRKNPADHEEVMKLLHEQLFLSTPGTMLHGMAVLQLGQMAKEKFERTNALEDLDEALRHLKRGVETLPHGHEKRIQPLNEISELYNSRYKKTNDLSDMRESVDYSDKIVAAIPPSHGVRSTYLLKLIRRLRDFSNSTTSIPDVERAISLGNIRLTEMPNSDSQRHNCRFIFSDVLSRKYILSRNLDNLVETVKFVQPLCYEFNELVKKSGSQPPVNAYLVYKLQMSVRKLSRAPQGQARTLANEKLYDHIASACKSKDFVNALLETQPQDEIWLNVYIDAAEIGEVLSEDEVQKRVGELERKEQAELSNRSSRPRFQPKEYKTELGARQLAIDPTNKKLVFDLSGLMENILGFGPTEPMSHTEFVAREARLERESFQKARAEGKDPNPKLCWMCRYLKPLKPISGGFTWEFELKFLPFGNWDQLKCRRSCSVCRLILSIIASDPQCNSINPRLAAIDREIAGIGLSLGELGTGETILKLDYGMRHVGELRILTPDNYIQALRQGWEVSDLFLRFTDALDSQEGPIHSRKGQQVDFLKVKQWLYDCDHNHGKACNSFRGDNPRYEADIPMTFVDVVDQCLVEATSATKYFALSYVWGSCQMSKTLRSNYAARLTKGGLSARLPNTIMDAIQLIRSLGERYLWVDSICIVQDGQEDKDRDIKHMDIVYSKAFATIVAMHGSNAEAGLPGVRKGTRLPQHIESVVISGRSEDLECDPDSKGKEYIYLIATPTPLHLALEVSSWDTRGWILQERLLSRRCLYFTDRYVYFQCSKEIVSESGINQPLRLKPEKWDAPGKVTFAEPPLINNPIVDLQGLAELGPMLRLSKSFTAYMKLVEMYTRRKLTYDSDITNAFSGMFAVLNGYFQSDILSGLPASALDLALLWAPAARLPRRGCRLPTTTSFDRGEVDRKFPSWSWVGWTGPVEYRFLMEAPDDPLPLPLVGSYTINVYGELQTIPARVSQEKASASMGSNTLFIAAVPQIVNAPALPNVLQFTAPCVSLNKFTIPSQRETLSRQDHIHATGDQSVRHILDPKGKRCGLWWEQAGYVYVGRSMGPEAESKMLMVGISQHGDTFRPRAGPNRVEGEIKMFDEEVYPTIGKGSGLVNVLAIDLDMGHEYAERITVARIHVKAWEKACPEMKMVRLA